MGIFLIDTTPGAIMVAARELQSHNYAGMTVTEGPGGIIIPKKFIIPSLSVMNLAEKFTEAPIIHKLKDSWVENGRLFLDYTKSQIAVPFSSQRGVFIYTNKETGVILEFDVKNPNKVYVTKCTSIEDAIGSECDWVDGFPQRKYEKDNTCYESVCDACAILQSTLPRINKYVQEARNRGASLQEIEQLGRTISEFIKSNSLENALYQATIPKVSE